MNSHVHAPFNFMNVSSLYKLTSTKLIKDIGGIFTRMPKQEKRLAAVHFSKTIRVQIILLNYGHFLFSLLEDL